MCSSRCVVVDGWVCRQRWREQPIKRWTRFVRWLRAHTINESWYYSMDRNFPKPLTTTVSQKRNTDIHGTAKPRQHEPLKMGRVSSAGCVRTRSMIADTTVTYRNFSEPLTTTVSEKINTDIHGNDKQRQHEPLKLVFMSKAHHARLY